MFVQTGPGVGRSRERLATTDFCNDVSARQVIRELITPAPESEVAVKGYTAWIGDDRRVLMNSSPTIIYLIVSCEKHKPRAVAHHEAIARYLQPCYIVLGNPLLQEAAFDGHSLTVPVLDNYESLPLKIMEGLVAVRRRFGPVGLLKIDDDLQFVSPPQRHRIPELVANTQCAPTSISAGTLGNASATLMSRIAVDFAAHGQAARCIISAPGRLMRWRGNTCSSEGSLTAISWDRMAVPTDLPEIFGMTFGMPPTKEHATSRRMVMLAERGHLWPSKRRVPRAQPKSRFSLIRASPMMAAGISCLPCRPGGLCSANAFPFVSVAITRSRWKNGPRASARGR
jgi:hypothetical protein